MELGERQEKNALPLRELAVFLIFGGLAALTNLFVGWQLYGKGWFPALPYWCATAIAATCGLLVNFGLNYAFNFKFRGRTALQQFSTFCVVALVGVADAFASAALASAAFSFAVLSAFAVQAVSGATAGHSIGTALAGLIVAVGGYFASDRMGGIPYFFASPFVLIYLYMMLPHEEHGHEESHAEAHATS